MVSLYGEKVEKPTESPSVGVACLTENLGRDLDARSSFYGALMKGMERVFAPSIRNLAENVVLGRVGGKPLAV